MKRTTSLPLSEARTFRLKHLAPTLFSTLLLDAEEDGLSAVPSSADRASVLDGIATLSPNDLTSRLHATGTPEGLQALAQLVQFLDVRPRNIRLDVALHSNSEPVAEGKCQTQNNTLNRISLVAGGKAFPVKTVVHVNGDGSVTVWVGLTQNGATAKQSRRARSGTRLTFWLGVEYQLVVTPTVVG